MWNFGRSAPSVGALCATQVGGVPGRPETGVQLSAGPGIVSGMVTGAPRLEIRAPSVSTASVVLMYVRDGASGPDANAVVSEQEMVRV